MRKLIAAMKTSLDGKIEGPEGYADWVDAWADDYGLKDQIDACLIGGGMYPGYEGYWTGLRDEPTTPRWITGAPPTAAELEWSAFAARTPHYVLSKTLTEKTWGNTHFLRGGEADVAALKQQPGKDIYLMGGARLTASLIDAGLVDEIRLLVYPLIAGPGKALFETSQRRTGLELRKAEALADGRLSLAYAVA